MRLLTVSALILAALTGCGTPLPPCPTEDYTGPVSCRWDAAKQGNGLGTSFTYDALTGSVRY